MLANARSTFSVESMALSAFASLFRMVCSALSALRLGKTAGFYGRTPIGCQSLTNDLLRRINPLDQLLS